jgi:intracellular multiplication protein IcmC
MAYTTISSGNQTINSLFGSGSKVGHSLSIIIQTLGYVAFLRGWMMIAKSAGQGGGGQGGSTGKGLVHVFGGILAINIVSTLQIVNNTLYGT